MSVYFFLHTLQSFYLKFSSLWIYFYVLQSFCEFFFKDKVLGCGTRVKIFEIKPNYHERPACMDYSVTIFCFCHCTQFFWEKNPQHTRYVVCKLWSWHFIVPIVYILCSTWRLLPFRIETCLACSGHSEAALSQIRLGYSTAKKKTPRDFKIKMYRRLKHQAISLLGVNRWCIKIMKKQQHTISQWLQKFWTGKMIM